MTKQTQINLLAEFKLYNSNSEQIKTRKVKIKEAKFKKLIEANRDNHE